MQNEIGPRLLPHRELDAACDALRACYSAAPVDLVGRYRQFEQTVLDHLAAEEDRILPGYADVAPVDAAAIRVEHAELRQHIYQLGADIELHRLHADTLDQLIAAVRAHAAREERAMYPWAAANLLA